MKRSSTFSTSSFVVLAAGILLLSCPAQAQTTYTSLTAWQAATAGSWQFSTSFQNFSRDTYFQTNAVNVGPFSLQQIGQDPTNGLFQNFIDVPPLQFTDNSGVTNAALYTKYGISTVSMAFSAPVFAWGANFYGAQSSELVNIVVTATGGSTIATIPVTVNNGFFGFVLSSSQQVGSIMFSSHINNPVQSVGQGFGLENVVGAYNASPSVVPASNIAITASGLAYSRVTQLFTGTVTIKNIIGTTINGPLQILFPSLPSGVTLVNAAGTYNGNPFVTINAASLAPGQSVTGNVQFSNPSNTAIALSPVAYAGGL